MHRWVFILLAAGLLMPVASVVRADDSTLIDSMDQVHYSAPAEKAHVTLVPGKVGQALTFSFDNDCQSVFIQGHVPGSPDWDKAAGFSFWVKGDGSDHLGGIEMIWNGDYGQRYGYAFPINGTEWRKVVVPWRDLTPELGGIAKGIDPVNGNAPSKLGPITFGKWWYWKDYAAHSYTIDDIRLVPTIPLDNSPYRPVGAPLARTLAKLKAGKPITVVTMGDSLTDTNHWTNRETNWPMDLKALVKQKYGADVTLDDPAMGGTELRQNLIVLPRWTSRTPQPDLVTILFGFNDYAAGMRGAGFTAAQQEAIDRVRRTTHGQADVLIMTTVPPLANADTLVEMAAAGREAARSRNAGLCDTDRAFRAIPQADQVSLHVPDGVHLSPAGQQLVAQTVLNALEQAGR